METEDDREYTRTVSGGILYVLPIVVVVTVVVELQIILSQYSILNDDA